MERTESWRGPSIGLDEALRARDARAERQARLIERWGRPLLSVTLVSPGPVKDSPLRRALMDRAEEALFSALAESGWAILERERLDAPTGPELILAVDCGPMELKLAAARVEEGGPWGRLVDADVVAGFAGGEGLPAGRSLPLHIRREELGAGPRPCLLCPRPAAECMAERRHGVEELAAEAERILAEAAGGLP